MLDHFVLMTDGGSVFCVLRVPTWPRLPLSAAWHQHKADAVKLNSGAESPAGGPDISWAADACYCRRLRRVSPGPRSSSPQNLSVPTGTEFPDRLWMLNSHKIKTSVWSFRFSKMNYLSFYVKLLMIFSDYIHSCSIDCCHTGVALWVTCWVHGLFCCSNVSTLTSYYPLWVSGPFIWWPRAGPLWGRVWAACGPWATVWIAKLKSVSRGMFTGSERYKNRHLHFIICQINEGQKRGRGQISIGPSILVPGPLTSWKTWAQILRFQCQPFRKSDSISSRLCFFSSSRLPCCYFHSDEGKVKEN